LLNHILTKEFKVDIKAFDFTAEHLWEISERARIPTRMPFGKYKGTPIADIPNDYKRWLLEQPDVDPYLAQALTGKKS
jgi:hypothetical protein